MPQRQVLDLSTAFSLARVGLHRLVQIESVGAQPVNPAGITRPEAIGVLDRQQALADAPQPPELDNDVGVFMLRDADRVERGVDPPQLSQPAHKPRRSLLR